MAFLMAGRKSRLVLHIFNELNMSRLQFIVIGLCFNNCQIGLQLLQEFRNGGGGGKAIPCASFCGIGEVSIEWGVVGR